MFFMMGIYDRTKEIKYSADMTICTDCGRYSSYRLFVTYMCLSIFFIPVLTWGKRYYVTSSCCGKSHELCKEKGRAAQRGEKIVITEADFC